jgi:hypothetical protein
MDGGKGRRRTGEKLVPGTQDFGLEEIGGVIGGEGLVDLEGGDFGWH